jgi:hypothetical protein
MGSERTMLSPRRYRAAALRWVAACMPGLLAAGCGTGRVDSVGGAKAPAPAAADCDTVRDRQTILAMAGEYEVRFSYEESLALAPSYTPRERYQVDGTELVLVVEDSPSRISLQHLLVLGPAAEPRVIKHWRQDWTFEDRELVQYRGGGTWQKAALSPEDARCAWTQAVFEVNDAPRYEGWGRWRYTDGTSSWTSSETWRPLPRREYTKRSDYDVLVGVNRQVLTPSGWAHEQDNTKLVLRGSPRALVREHGVNVYVRTGARDFAPARDYWRRTETFWRDVRAVWTDLIAAGNRLSLRPGVDGTAQHESLLLLANDRSLSEAGKAGTRRQRIQELIRESWESGPTRAAAAAR